MPILYVTDPRFLEHHAGHHHPEKPARLEAVEAGIAASGVVDAVIREQPLAADIEAVQRVHPGPYVSWLEEIAAQGGGAIDADTIMNEASYDAALLAAGAGLHAVDALRAGRADAAFCAVRPPGHHATPSRPMGFCLLNNIAVTAAALADQGERVLIVDFDAHHGNGTQDAFYADPRVHFVSMHQYPFYPGTGALDETGAGEGEGTTINVPLPAYTTGDVYRRVVDEVINPLVDRWQPTWLLVSAGYDAHRLDPLTELGLTSGDYADLVRALLEAVPRGRAILFLEGGYDLDALTSSVAATFAVLAEPEATRDHTEHPTSGGPGHTAVDAVVAARDRAAAGG